MRGNEPVLRALPLGLRGEVKVVGAERAVAVCEQKRSCAEPRLQSGLGGEREAAVVAIRLEAGGEIAREREFLLPPGAAERCHGVLFIEAEVAGAAKQFELAGVE